MRCAKQLLIDLRAALPSFISNPLLLSGGSPEQREE